MIILGLGSNLGNREENLVNAINLLVSSYDIELDKTASIYETEPVGYKEQPNFLNTVISVVTSLTPAELLDACLSVERELGRIRERKWGPRIIDIDLLFYHNINIFGEVLTIPHPRMHERAFVLFPLAEIAGDLPIYKGMNAVQLLKHCQKQNVTVYKKMIISGGKIIGVSA